MLDESPPTQGVLSAGPGRRKRDVDEERSAAALPEARGAWLCERLRSAAAAEILVRVLMWARMASEN